MFKGIKPTSQPRSLRSVAESKGTAPNGFDGQLEYDAKGGVPLGARTSGAVYVDAAEGARPVLSKAVRAPMPTDPQPFK